MRARYNSIREVNTPLDPLEDITSWIQTLGSQEYSADLLREVHGIVSREEIKRSSATIGILASSAAGFIEQAFAGPPAISFLPLYYALLDLSKIYILAANRRSDLEKHRFHGVGYNPVGKKSQRLFTEHVTLRGSGVLPIFYEVLTGTTWKHGNRQVAMGSLYPFIISLSHEYTHLYDTVVPLQELTISAIESPSSMFRLNASAHSSQHPDAGKLRYLKMLRGFRSREGKSSFRTPPVQAVDLENALTLLEKHVIWNLSYGTVTPAGRVLRHRNSITVQTPVAAETLLLPEELPIWLVFFHLSSVVRYNPEFMNRLTNSKDWGLLSALRRHAVLRFLLLTWSNIHKTEFVVHHV